MQEMCAWCVCSSAHNDKAHRLELHWVNVLVLTDEAIML